ncbi:hypothetical protein Calag_1156 [Caldisphaera lagunensis DSM 15908]|uniref:Uncharacterized protein n=1 Tax=Caldisphaera lagunensis (strain DSM 15908 / JCM 11604 / ANMR 0165 / IC-154) TaxID=1056495 RepID=L0AAE1_CALLD|nr:hypothetical protein [Caldisphaera lagunensis]AFZ70878.1 hypothetical protein Calag_1156 [Caldisphaera lagunensis DSM 15908]
MLDESSWELQKERPMALVLAIIEKTHEKTPISISNYMKKLINIDSWIGRYSLLLSENPDEIAKIINDLDLGVLPRKDLVKKVLDTISKIE